VRVVCVLITQVEMESPYRPRCSGNSAIRTRTTRVAAQFPPVLRRHFLPVSPVRRNQRNAAFGKFSIQRVGVVSLVADQSFRSLSGKNLSERFSDKGDFMRLSRRRVDGKRKISAVCHCHKLRTFALLGLYHSESLRGS
jgi:hypothetical protein